MSRAVGTERPPAPRPARAALLGRLDHTEVGSSPERGRDRQRRVAVAAAAGIGSRALSALSLLIALPLAAARLDHAALGVWTLLVTAVALVGFVDLGVSNGLVNVLSNSIGSGDHETARRAVSAAWYGLLAIAAAGAVVGAVLVAVVPWDDLLNAGRPVGDLRPAVATFAAMVLLSVPAGIGQRIHLAYQQGWATAAVNGIGSVLSIVGVVAAAAAHAGLPWFVAAMLGGNAVAFAGETAWVFLRSHPDLRPRRSALERAVLDRILRTGALFFVLALAGAAAYQSDSIVISNRLGAAAVTRYAVTLRLFTLAPTALAAMVMPLWPAYGEAIARRDVGWIRRTLVRSLVGTLVVSVAASLVVLVVAGPLLEHWSSGVAAPSRGLLAALALWAVVSAVSTTLAAYFNGANIIRFQVVVGLVMATTNLALSLVLVGRWGIVGPVWASVITQSLVVLVPELVIVRRVVKRARPSAPATVAA